MFSLLYGLWKYLFSKAEFHVLILGIDKAGKTDNLSKWQSDRSAFVVVGAGAERPTGKCVSVFTMLMQTLLEKLKTLYSDFEGLPPDRIVPTVGLNIGRIEAHKSKLIFWDLGGQLGLRTIWEKYYEEAHAILYVVDAASESRLEDTKSAFEKVLRHQDLQGAPVLIFANKQDLEGAVSAKEIGTALNLKELEERESMAMAISAYDGSGIREGVTWLVDAMRTCKRTQELKQRADAAVTM